MGSQTQMDFGGLDLVCNSIMTGATEAGAAASPLASANQAAVTPSTDFTGADTVSKATVLAAVQAVETLVNQIRSDLVTANIIKGSA